MFYIYNIIIDIPFTVMIIITLNSDSCIVKYPKKYNIFTVYFILPHFY